MLKGRGDGSFFDRTDSPTGAGPLSLASGDFNGDSRPDVAVLCAGNNSITVLLNTGASWVTPVAVSDLEAEWSATGATLHWKFFGSNGSAVRVQRAGVGRSYVDVSVDLLADPGAAAMTFVDASAAAGNSYIYRLAWRERGAVHTSSEVHLAPPGLAFSLGEPVPNPTAGSVSFRFALPSQSVARLEILDVSGRRVRLILDAVRSPGPGTATWDGRGVDGSPMPAGIYFARLEAAGRVLRRRVMMLK